MEEDKDFICFYDNYWNCTLPINGSDDPAYVNMGIEFGPFIDGEQFRDSKLPDGWRIEDANKKYWHNIIDSKNRIRAEFFDHNIPHISSRRRFSHSHIEEEISVIFCVYDNNHEIGQKSPIVFKKEFPTINKDSHRQTYDQVVASYIKDNICENWLNENYPKWQDSSKYWEEETCEQESEDINHEDH
jgi:hypothetical protein